MLSRSAAWRTVRSCSGSRSFRRVPGDAIGTNPASQGLSCVPFSGWAGRTSSVLSRGCEAVPGSANWSKCPACRSGTIQLRLARTFAAQVVAEFAEDTLSGRAWCQLAELLGVRLHRFSGRWLEVDLRAHRAGNAVQSFDRRVRIRAFELGDGRLAHAGELRELGLRQAQVLAHPAQLQLHGEL